MDGPLDVERALQVGVLLAGALETAHRAGIVHGDLQPARLVFGAHGEPLLVETGLAGFAVFPGLGALNNPVRYHAPPEVLERTEVSPATDVYSLATTVYALLAGAGPAAEAGRGDRQQRVAAAAHPADAGAGDRAARPARGPRGRVAGAAVGQPGQAAPAGDRGGVAAAGRAAPHRHGRDRAGRARPRRPRVRRLRGARPRRGGPAPAPRARASAGLARGPARRCDRPASGTRGRRPAPPRARPPAAHDLPVRRGASRCAGGCQPVRPPASRRPCPRTCTACGARRRHRQPARRPRAVGRDRRPATGDALWPPAWPADQPASDGSGALWPSTWPAGEPTSETPTWATTPVTDDEIGAGADLRATGPVPTRPAPRAATGVHRRPPRLRGRQRRSRPDPR